MKLCTSFGQDWACKVVTFRLVTSEAREKTDSRRSGMFQSCFRMTRSCFGISSRYLRVLWFILILIYYSGQKYWLKKYFTENIEAVWVSSFKIRAKIEMPEKFSVRLTSQTSLLVSCYVAWYVSPKCVSVWLFTVETFILPWNLAWNSFYAMENRNFVSLPIIFPADRSKFQFCTTARSNLIIIFTRTVLPCLCFFFLNPAVEIMLNMLFNTLLNVLLRCYTRIILGV